MTKNKTTASKAAEITATIQNHTFNIGPEFRFPRTMRSRRRRASSSTPSTALSGILPRLLGIVRNGRTNGFMTNGIANVLKANLTWNDNLSVWLTVECSRVSVQVLDIDFDTLLDVEITMQRALSKQSHRVTIKRWERGDWEHDLFAQGQRHYDAAWLSGDNYVQSAATDLARSRPNVISNLCEIGPYVYCWQWGSVTRGGTVRIPARVFAARPLYLDWR